MSEEKKTRKKKLLIRYLILAACILVVAAVTVTTVFAVNDWFRSDITIDNNNGNKPPVDPDDGNKPDEPDKPTINETTFAQPVANLDVINSFDFFKNESLHGTWHFHTGVDMAAEVGTNVIACLDGTIDDVTVDDRLDGTTVTILHANGLKTKYGFINAKSGLKKGDAVKRGDTIGTVAEPCGSEYKQVAHLHFEVIENGEQKDPAKWLDIAEK